VTDGLGLSISETTDLLRFSNTTTSRVYREWSEKEKISSQRQVRGEWPDWFELIERQQ